MRGFRQHRSQTRSHQGGPIGWRHVDPHLGESIPRAGSRLQAGRAQLRGGGPVRLHENRTRRGKGHAQALSTDGDRGARHPMDDVTIVRGPVLAAHASAVDDRQSVTTAVTARHDARFTSHRRAGRGVTARHSLITLSQSAVLVRRSSGAPPDVTRRESGNGTGLRPADHTPCCWHAACRVGRVEVSEGPPRRGSRRVDTQEEIWTA